MKTIFAILSLILMMNTSMAAGQAGLKNALDEFTYVMTVEGAALDAGETKAAMDSFRERTQALNLTREEIVDEVLARIADQKTADVIKSALSHIQSQEEMNVLLQEMVNRNQEGASWNGRNALQMMSTILLAGAIMGGFIYIFFLMPDCDPNKEQCS